VGVLPTQWIRSGFSAQENPHSNVATCATLEWGTLAFPNRAVVVKLSLSRAGAWTETTLHDFGARRRWLQSRQWPDAGFGGQSLPYYLPFSLRVNMGLAHLTGIEIFLLEGCGKGPFGGYRPTSSHMTDQLGGTLSAAKVIIS
jgi:hypothetical protein